MHPWYISVWQLLSFSFYAHPPLSFFTAVFSFVCDNYCGLQTARTDWKIHNICWLENCLSRKRSLGYEANALGDVEKEFKITNRTRFGGLRKHLLKNHVFLHVPWRRTWQPTLVFLPGKSPQTEEPGGLQSMGSQRVRPNWTTKHILFLKYRFKRYFFLAFY